MLRELNRRTFLGSTAAGVAAATMSRGANVEAAPLRLGVIGCGGYGRQDLQSAFNVGGVRVVALADVDSAHLEATSKFVKENQDAAPQTFKLYDTLLDMPELDAVILATPPHWHALPFIAACKRGLHIYCEKPLAYDIRESRAMVDAAHDSPSIVQVGFQRRDSAGFREAREFIRSSGAGNIVCVDAQIHWPIGVADPKPQEPPATLDWNLWCGPAPKIPYSPQVGHRHWRYEKTTGNGHLIDWGIHLVDAARWILGVDAPTSVSASGGLYAMRGQITTPDVMTADFIFDRYPVTWRHRIWGAAEYTPEIKNGLLFYGDEATVFVTEDRWVVIPRKQGADRTVHETPSNPQRAHMADFLDAVRSGRQPSCPIEDGYHSTTAVTLAMIAYDTATKVTWDAKIEQIVDNPAASALLKRDYREPWRHPYQG